MCEHKRRRRLSPETRGRVEAEVKRLMAGTKEELEEKRSIVTSLFNKGNLEKVETTGLYNLALSMLSLIPKDETIREGPKLFAGLSP